MKPKQLNLNLTAAQRVAKRREAADLYEAAVTVRNHGKTCYRSGRGVHVVDGMRMTDSQLLAHARHLHQREIRG